MHDVMEKDYSLCFVFRYLTKWKIIVNRSVRLKIIFLKNSAARTSSFLICMHFSLVGVLRSISFMKKSMNKPILGFSGHSLQENSNILSFFQLILVGLQMWPCVKEFFKQISPNLLVVFIPMLHSSNIVRWPSTSDGLVFHFF